MERLKLEATPDTPEIVLDKGAGLFEIAGRSLPEDAVDFYAPVFSWIKEYGKAPNATTPFKFRMEYFNTASSKLLYELILLLGKINGVAITWHFYEDDEEMEEAGKEFAEQATVPFEVVAVPWAK